MLMSEQVSDVRSLLNAGGFRKRCFYLIESLSRHLIGPHLLILRQTPTVSENKFLIFAVEDRIVHCFVGFCSGFNLRFAFNVLNLTKCSTKSSAYKKPSNPQSNSWKEIKIDRTGSKDTLRSFQDL
ncbi:unnamed protein product [Lactuca virosa]|uniref:Uncharacterized protein n=1 Tax=Lactuca virosa TaxID=75947 RepID=A0AAU9P8P2_9ASTR|nr:unnamed protein product [Lactuca virosa]